MVENPTPKDVEKMPTIRIILDDNGEEFYNLTMFGQLWSAFRCFHTSNQRRTIDFVVPNANNI